MKTILLSVVLGVTMVAVAQNAAQPAQGQSSAPAQGQSQGPVIKDPAEYNAYVAAVQQKDPNAKVSGLEAFLTQYPNSVMKNEALRQLMLTYQQTGNVAKTTDTASKLVAADPCNMQALALLAYLDRYRAQNDPSAAGLVGDAKKYGEQGMGCWPKVTDPDMNKPETKAQLTNIFQSAIGVADCQSKDYAGCIAALKPVADATPQDFSVVYPLALAYWPDPKTPTTPENSRLAIWYAARASAIAPPAAQAQIEKYAKSLYRRFHGDEDGWPAFLAQAKAGTAAPANLEAMIPPAPTPQDQAHDMVTKTAPDKMDFAQWEFVLSNGTQADQDTVWNAIKGKAVQMNGTVISTEPDTFMIAGSSDDIDAKKADITLKFEEKVPARLIPKDGASFDFQGEPASYTPNPFMMVMEKGTLLKAKAAPAPVHKAPVRKKPAAQ